MKFTPRDYQLKDINDIRQAYNEGFKSVLYCLPTGGGKTFVFSYIADAIKNKKKKANILVHRIELLRQSHGALENLNVQHGLVSPKYTPDPRQAIQVSSVQTLVRRLERYQAPDLLIIDEGHHATAGTYRKIIAAFPNTFILGVTATPCRGDDQGLGIQAGGIYDKLISNVSMEDLIEKGFLSDYKMFCPNTKIDLKGISKDAFGDFSKGQLATAMDKKYITGDAVKHYKKICPGAPAIAFCASVDHCRHVAVQFKSEGIAASYIDGTMDDNTRTQRIKALGDGTLKVLASCDLISEGTDIPIVTTAILLRPTMSMALFLQQCGRVLRPHKDKKFSFIIDHVGNIDRHGEPALKRKWTLTGGAVDKDDLPQLKECKKCFAKFKNHIMKCPECGAEVEKKEVDRTPEEKEGDLVERERKLKQVEKRKTQGQANDLEKLKALEKKLGYKPGWAEHILASRKDKELKVKFTNYMIKRSVSNDEIKAMIKTASKHKKETGATYRESLLLEIENYKKTA